MKQFDDICEVESDKAATTITSRYDGLIKTLHYKVDEVALVGSALLDIELDDDSQDVTGETVKSAENQETDNSENKESNVDEVESEDNILEKILTTPAVRKIARENDVRLEDITGTGKGGRVLKEDILAYLQKISEDPKVKTKGAFPNVTGKTVGLKGYTKYMWTTMTKSLVSCRENSYAEEIVA